MALRYFKWLYSIKTQRFLYYKPKHSKTVYIKRCYSVKKLINYKIYFIDCKM